MKLINQSKATLMVPTDNNRAFQLGLTYCVPHIVATNGAASLAAQAEKSKEA